MRNKSIREQMILSAQEYYDYEISKATFNRMTDKQLLAFCSPGDREEFKRKLLT